MDSSTRKEINSYCARKGRESPEEYDERKNRAKDKQRHWVHGGGKEAYIENKCKDAGKETPAEYNARKARVAEKYGIPTAPKTVAKTHTKTTSPREEDPEWYTRLSPGSKLAVTFFASILDGMLKDR